MTARLGRWEAWRHCCKGTVIFVVGPVVFLFALVMQAGMLKFSHGTKQNSWTITLEGMDNGTELTGTSSEIVSVDANNTCLSRLQHMLHRPSSQVIPPSPVLMQTIAAYEKHHANCFRATGGNWSEAFVGRLGKSDDSPNSKDHNDGCKYLVFFESGAGVGNRLMSLVSAITYALLTNRIILLSSGDAKGQIARLLCEPFGASSWVLPDEFPLDLLESAPDFRRAVRDPETFQNMTVVGLKLEHNDDSEFFCMQPRKDLESVPWVVYNSNQYHVPRMFTFPEFWPSLLQIFPDPSHTFTHLSRHFLLPKNLIWEKIVRIYDSYLASADATVGIQIRRHSKPEGDAEFTDQAMDRILSCLVAHRVLPKATPSGGLSEQMLERMNRRASAAVLSASSTSKRIRRMSGLGDQGSSKGTLKTTKYAEGVTSLLVVSLEQKFAQAMEDLYTNNATADGRLVRVHMVTHEGFETHTFEQAAKAFIEMWLLSLCDNVATSGWSTFGYVAQGLGGMRPHILALKGDLSDENANAGRLDLDALQDTTIPHLHCALGQSSEPCNHFPFYPKLNCGEDEALRHTPEHEEWLRRHLLPCQDEPHGRQLIL